MDLVAIRHLLFWVMCGVLVLQGPGSAEAGGWKPKKSANQKNRKNQKKQRRKTRLKRLRKKSNRAEKRRIKLARRLARLEKLSNNERRLDRADAKYSVALAKARLSRLKYERRLVATWRREPPAELKEVADMDEPERRALVAVLRVDLDRQIRIQQMELDKYKIDLKIARAGEGAKEELSMRREAIEGDIHDLYDRSLAEVDKTKARFKGSASAAWRYLTARNEKVRQAVAGKMRAKQADVLRGMKRVLASGRAARRSYKTASSASSRSLKGELARARAVLDKARFDRRLVLLWEVAPPAPVAEIDETVRLTVLRGMKENLHGRELLATIDVELATEKMRLEAAGKDSSPALETLEAERAHVAKKEQRNRLLATHGDAYKAINSALNWELNRILGD
jgi:hypothetical protein